MKSLRYYAAFSAVFGAFFVFDPGGVEAQTDPARPQLAKNQEEARSTNSETPAGLKTEVAPTVSFSTSRTAPAMTRVGVQTSDTVPLTLNEAIRRALENNNDIEIAKTDVRIAESNLRSLLGIYDGVFTISPNFTRTSNTGQAATRDFRVNADFNRQIRPGGGNIRGFFNNNRTENQFAQQQVTSGSASSSSAVFSSSLGATYTQPLWRDFKIDANRRQIKIQRKRVSQSDADFRRQAIATIAQVQTAYWDLVFALRNQQNQVANVNLSRENLRQVEAKISAGTAAPLQKAEVETELANREGELLSATQQVATAENRLKQLFLREAESREWSVSIVPTDAPVMSNDPILLDAAMKDAMDFRPELSRLRLEKEINTIDVDFYKNQTKPQIDLVTTYSLAGLAFGSVNTSSFTAPLFTRQTPGTETNASSYLYNLICPIPANCAAIPTVVVPGTANYYNGGFGRSLANLFRSDASNFTVGVTISFPLRNTTAKADLTTARIQNERIDAQTRSQEQAVVAEVRNAVQAAETARQRITTARRARENAEIQLDGERRLFEVGRSTTFILFQRENALTNARNSEIRAETDYNKALSELQRVTSTTFRVNNIQVDSPVRDQQ